jgi:hypothetical protein
LNSTCKIKKLFGPLGGLIGLIVGSCPGAPDIRMVVVDNELRYIHKDYLLPADTPAAGSQGTL